MKRKPLSDYLKRIKSSALKQDWANVRRLTEKVLEKLSALSYTPKEEFDLYRRLADAYYSQGDFSRSLEACHKAYLIALKYRLEPAQVVFISGRIGDNLLGIRNINGALEQFHKVDEYYKKYSDSAAHPMDKQENYIANLFGLAYCYLAKNDIDKVREIIEIRIPPDKQFLTTLIASDYHHLKGEYLMAIEDYAGAQRSFRESIKSSEQLRFSQGTLESKMHLAMIDIITGRLEDAVRTLEDIRQESRRLKLNYLVCEAGLLLSKCYVLKGMTAKAKAIENSTRPFLSKMDIGWFYEKSRELERFFRQVQARRPESKPQAGYLPEALTKAMNHHYETALYREVIIGQSGPMQDVYQLLEKVAPTDLPVLLQGETGTGKELVAHALHQNSPRAGKPWLAFNCGALPETLLESELFGHTKGSFTGAYEDKRGYIEIASGGTLLLDEVSAMSPALQQKLLRVIEDHYVWPVGSEKSVPVNTRFIFASNRNIEQLVRQGAFREDLFYRINTIVINLPALRDRKDDIPLLTGHFLRRYSQKMIGKKGKMENLTAGKEQSAICISQSAMDMLGNYPWPGNVRELENEIKRICTLYTDIKIIEESMCSESIRNYPTVEMPRISFNPNRRASLKELTDTFQVNIITEAVTKCKGNMARTARLLGCTRAVLYKKIGRLKISL